MRKSTFEVPKIMSLGDNSPNEGLGRLFTAICAPGKYWGQSTAFVFKSTIIRALT